MRIHWLQQVVVTDWLAQQRSLLQPDDVIIVTDQALLSLPPQAPCANQMFALAEELQPGDQLPRYIGTLTDSEWVSLVLTTSQQMTW